MELCSFHLGGDNFMDIDLIIHIEPPIKATRLHNFESIIKILQLYMYTNCALIHYPPPPPLPVSV